jgi:hypothetical protein
MPYMDIRVLVQRFELTLLPLCAKWDIHPVQAKRGFAAGAVLFDLGGNGAFWKKRV